jgi:hypothetical protein
LIILFYQLLRPKNKNTTNRTAHRKSATFVRQLNKYFAEAPGTFTGHSIPSDVDCLKMAGSSSSGMIRTAPVKILRHDDNKFDDDFTMCSGQLHWKSPPTSSALKARYVCIDPSRQYCAVYLLEAFVVELWDIGSLPCLMSRLKLPSLSALPPPWDSSCQCMAWSGDGRFLCSVFGGRSLDGCSLVMVWEVESSCLISMQQYVKCYVCCVLYRV